MPDKVLVPYIEHVPPDTTAGIFWLKNRKSAEWRDIRSTELSGPSQGPISVKDVSEYSDSELASILAGDGGEGVAGQKEGEG
jgi:hypothetical protein